MNLLEMLAGQMSGDRTRQLGQTLGADDATTKRATGAALGTLIEALGRNASQQNGSEALHRALAKDHDGGVLNNIGDLLGDPSKGPGEGILRHVLGDRRAKVEAGLSAGTGMDKAAVGKLLASLAPMVLGALGKQQREQKMGASDLSKYLGQQRREVERHEPKAAGMLGKLLDADGDGDFDMGDAAKHVFGKLFGGK